MEESVEKRKGGWAKSTVEIKLFVESMTKKKNKWPVKMNMAFSYSNDYHHWAFSAWDNKVGSDDKSDVPREEKGIKSE